MLGFGRFKIFNALRRNKTVINFQYVDGKGIYFGNGDIGEMLEFSAGAIAKICVQAGNQLNEDDVKNILKDIRKQVLTLYKKNTGCLS